MVKDDFCMFNENLIQVFSVTLDTTRAFNIPYVTINDFIYNIYTGDIVREKLLKLGMEDSSIRDKFWEKHDLDLVHRFLTMNNTIDSRNALHLITDGVSNNPIASDIESKEIPGFSIDFEFLLKKLKNLYQFRLEKGSDFQKDSEITKHTEGDRAKIDLIDALNVIEFYRDKFHLKKEIFDLLENTLTYPQLYKLMNEEFKEGNYKLREDCSGSIGDDIKIIGIELSQSEEGTLKEKHLDWNNNNKNQNMKNKNKKYQSIFEDEDSDSLFEKAGAEGKILSEKQANCDGSMASKAIPTLDQYGRNLNNAVLENKIDPIIGREKEIDQLIDILRCRKKTSAILIGEAGCGKTAVVEGLAKKLNSGDVPEVLKGKKVYSITTSDLTAGTMYRGQLEERLQNIINELREAKDVILYIDEFHQATGEEKSTSIADILKPSLSRGEISVIASTTTREYKKFVEIDAALRRRFQKIIIEAPTKDATLNILKGLAKVYSDHHKVNYSDEVLKACVNWSDKYIYDRQFPDKAIDVLDIAGSLAAKEVQKQDQDQQSNIKMLEKIRSEKIRAVCKEANFTKGFKLRDKEENFKKKNGIVDNNNNFPDVSLEDVALVISRYTNIPIDKIINPEMDKLRLMKQNLLNKIIGQDEAIKTATMSLSKSYLGLRDENKPIAALMFVGPTGVGKTMLCEEICNTIYGDPKALVRIDCGEYSQPHTVTKLIGAPASYVGYGEPGILDQIRERPNSLVLFDEIEKMHPDIINTLFLNILSTGMITMSNGVEVSFRNCIVVFTGNVGTKELELKGNGIGFCELNSQQKNSRNSSIIRDALKKQFRPEFINRLTNITVFNELSKEDMAKIFDLELNKLKTRLKEKNYDITITDDLKDFIISKVDTKYGARDLSRGITTWIEDKICEYMIEKNCSGKSVFELSLKKDTSIVKAK